MWKRKRNEFPDRAPRTGEPHGTTESSEDNDQVDPFSPIVDAIGELNSPVATLALAIAMLTARGALGRREHLQLGLREETISTLMRCVDNNNTAEGLVEDLETYAALREYNKQVESIANSEGVVLPARDIVLFATDLARFALENSIEDLEVAARLLRAEQPERYYAHFRKTSPVDTDIEEINDRQE